MNTTKLIRLSLALVVTLMLVGVVRADVIYTTGVNLQVFPNSYLGLMIETNTYAFWTNGYDNFKTDSDLIIRNFTGVDTEFIPGDNNLFRVAFQAGQADVPSAIKYAAGETIGPSSNGYGWGYLSQSATEHSWGDGERGYAGIAKYSWQSETYQYGWVDIGRSYDNGVSGSVYTVYGWAWDTTLNETINAGTFVGNVIGSSSAVPEPSSFAMLAIGGLVLGGYAWRKKKQQTV